MTVERAVRSLVLYILPRRIAAEAAEDLLDDYRRVRDRSGLVAAAAFLAREAVSLMGAFLVAGLTRTIRSAAVIRRDVLHAWRALARRPWAGLGAVLMLAAGLAAIGATSGLISTLLFRPVSSRYPDAVQRVAAVNSAGRPRLGFSEVELARVREHAGGAISIAVANLQPVLLRAAGVDSQTLAEVVAGPYFDLVGMPVPAGRPLVDSDAAPGAPPIVVISDALWRDRYGRAPSAIGATIRLNGHMFTIAGVTTGAGTSSLLGGSVDAWITVAHADTMLDRTWRTNPNHRWWTTLVRLAPGTAKAPLQAALDRAAADLAAQLPDPWRELELTTLPGTLLTGRQRDLAITLSAVLMALAVLILAAAAANVSGLFLAAAAAERGRAAIQLAIGAGRAAIIRRHLVEGALIGLGAGVAALAIYAWIRRQLVHVTLLPTLSLSLDLPADARIVATTLATGGVAGVLLRLGPALWVTRLDVARTLRDGARGGSVALSRSRHVLVTAQVAISITLLAGAMLFARSVDTLATLDLGFPRHGLIAMDFDLEPSAPAPDMLPSLAREALDRAGRVPGVVAAAMSNRAPIDSSTPTVSAGVAGSSQPPIEDVTFYLATERYFETVGLGLVLGRAFTAAEVAREDAVAIVNETLARRLWADGDALDRGIELQPQGRTVRVVGIARDSKYRSLAERARPHLYLPGAPNFSRSLLVRTHDDPRRALQAVQAVLDAVGPGIVGFFPRTLDDHLAIDTLPARASARAAGVLAALALALSGAGLYGIVMWFVEIRRREIGVRMALGASASDVRRLVVRQAAAAAAPGVIVGLAAALALTAFGRALFVGVEAIDPASLLVGILVLGAIVMAASYLPSRRATQVDPVIVLREG